MIAVGTGDFEHISYPMTRYGWRRLEPASISAGIRLVLSRRRPLGFESIFSVLPAEPVRETWLRDARALADSIDQHVQANPHMGDFDRPWILLRRQRTGWRPCTCRRWSGSC